MKIINVTDRKQLDELYNQSALTFEGLRADAESLRMVELWLSGHNAITGAEVVAHIIKGKFMNRSYDLTGNNAYPDDLTIVSFTGIDQLKIAIPRFEYGGRWFDDIVANNARREEEKRGGDR